MSITIERCTSRHRHRVSTPPCDQDTPPLHHRQPEGLDQLSHQSVTARHEVVPLPMQVPGLNHSSLIRRRRLHSRANSAPRFCRCCTDRRDQSVHREVAIRQQQLRFSAHREHRLMPVARQLRLREHAKDSESWCGARYTMILFLDKQRTTPVVLRQPKSSDQYRLTRQQVVRRNTAIARQLLDSHLVQVVGQTCRTTIVRQ